MIKFECTKETSRPVYNSFGAVWQKFVSYNLYHSLQEWIESNWVSLPSSTWLRHWKNQALVTRLRVHFLTFVQFVHHLNFFHEIFTSVEKLSKMAVVISVTAFLVVDVSSNWFHINFTNNKLISHLLILIPKLSGNSFHSILLPHFSSISDGRLKPHHLLYSMFCTTNQDYFLSLKTVNYSAS